MKINLYILCIPFIVLSQLIIENDRCASEKEKAFKDFNNGTIVLTTHGGQMNPDQIKFQFYYRNYLYSKYHITLIDQGCNLGTKTVDSCYYHTMDSLFTRKYGSDFLMKTRTRISTTYHSLSQQEKASVLSDDKVYAPHELEISPSFMGNKKIIKAYFIKKYHIPSQEFQALVSILVIGNDGKIIDYNLDIFNKGNNKFHISRQQKKEDLRAINKLGSFTPGSIYDKKVNGEMFL